MVTIQLYLVLIFGVLLLFIIGILLILNLIKKRQINEYKQMLIKLKRSFNELDEQAKLIVRTDLELNKTQEELDKRLNGLEALQKISRLISTTIEEEALFHRLKQSLMESLTYEKSCVFLYDQSRKLYPRVYIGYTPAGIQSTLSKLEKESVLIASLQEGNTFSSVNITKQKKDSIKALFEVEHFVISPILTQQGAVGIIFMGNLSNASPINEGDEELTSILANQIGQSLENARLFEEIYRSSKDLENKVQDRTSQLQDALLAVQNISKTKSEFISAVSHELRTPLTSIKGYASLLIEGKLGDIPTAVKERLAKINIHSDNLVKLINDLLDISRIESGKVEMDFEECHLQKIIEDVYDILTPQFKNKNINWKSDIDTNIPEMFLDKSQIERVFINLIGNALKFTPEKGLISVKTSINKDLVTIEVTDTGIGISPEDANKLFEEFYRVDNQINQNVKGTGLGLPLAKKIVEAHKGTMWITSEINRGSTFNFTLPVISQKDLKKENEKDKAKS